MSGILKYTMILFTSVFLYAGAVSAQSYVPIQEDVIPILGYHNVLADNDLITSPTLEIKQSDFEEQIRYMTQELDCNWMTMTQIIEDYMLQEKKLPKNACAINFDDGKRNTYLYAYPILEEYDVKATFYISPAKIGHGNYMEWQHLDELDSKGHDIENHGYDHKGLVTGGLTNEEKVFEISEGKRILEDHGFDVKTYAYPYGEWDDEAVSILKDTNHIGGRDIQKPSWMRLSTVTTSARDDEEMIWSINYIKPERLDNEDLDKIVKPSYWYQFEDDFSRDFHSDAIIRGYKPTDTSYAIVELPRTKQQISSTFLVPEEGKYRIQIYGVTGYSNSDKDYERLNTIRVEINRYYMDIEKGDGSDCVDVSNYRYCSFYVEKDLEKGKHTLSIESKDGVVRVDKFKVYRDTDDEEVPDENEGRLICYFAPN